MSDDDEPIHPTPDGLPVLSSRLLSRRYGPVMLLRESGSSRRWMASSAFVENVEKRR